MLKTKRITEMSDKKNQITLATWKSPFCQGNGMVSSLMD